MVLRTLVRRAGGGSGRSQLDYEYDESKYKGFWKYYNNDTPTGRFGCSVITISVVGLLISALVWRNKSKKKALEAGTNSK